MIKSIYHYAVFFFKRKKSPEYFWEIRTRILNTHNKFLRKYYEHIYNSILAHYNSFIPFQCTISGLPTFPHELNGIFISLGARIGTNCTIFQQVTIGSNTLPDSKRYGAPNIGNNVYIGCGAKIIGNVTVGDNCRIGANCVVTKDVPPNSTVVLQQPKIIVHTEQLDNSFIMWR